MAHGKTLLLTLDFWPNTGGKARYYSDLCSFLHPSAIAVLTDGRSNKFSFSPAAGAPAYHIFRRRLLWHFFWPRWLPIFFHLAQIVRLEKIKILWVGDILPCGFVVFLFSKLRRLPYIVSCHGTDILYFQKNRRKKKIALAVLRSASFITANSFYTRDLLLKLGLTAEKIKVIYPSLPVGFGSRFDFQEAGQTLARRHRLSGKKIILSLGRLVPRKGFDQVISALPTVWRSLPQAVYLIAGSGPEKQRLEILADRARRIFFSLGYARDLSSADPIVFLGQVSEEYRRALYHLCHVFISPGREAAGDIEGFGIVFLEAGGCAKPVIAGRAGGTGEAVIDGETGILVNGKNRREIARVLIDLLLNEKKAASMGAAAYRRTSNFFTLEKNGRAFRELLDHLSPADV